MIAALFETVAIVSLTTSAVILPLAICSSRINRRYAVRWKYWIWILLALRLLLPWNPPLPVTVVTVKPVAAAVPAAQTQDLPAPTAVPAALPAAPAAAPVSQTAPAASSFTLRDGLAFTWAVGMGVFLFIQLAGYLHFCHQLRRWGKPVTKGAAYDILRAEAAHMGLETPVLLRGRMTQSPLITGFLRPVLALPQEEYSLQQLPLILRHELTHLRRRDLWYKLLLISANAVHWFNPIVYLMVREANLDLEISCDHAVAQTLDPEGRRMYGEAIMDVLHHRQRHTSSLSTYFWGGTAAMKERFRAILDTGGRRKGAAAFLAVLCAAGLAGGLVSCEAETGLHTLSAPAGETASPVSVSLELPEGWSIGYFEDGSSGGFSIRNAQGEEIGQGGFWDFDWYPNAGSYRAVYSAIMLGSVTTWDNEYTLVKTTGAAETATCRPVRREPAQGQSMAEAPELYQRGILSYDTKLLAYVTLCFEEDAITQEQLNRIAQSLTLASTLEHPAQEIYGVDQALTALEQTLVERGIIRPGLQAADGRDLHWLTDQMRVAYMGGVRTLFAALEDEQGNAIGEYAAQLDGSGVYQCLEQGLAVQLGGDGRYRYSKGRWETLTEELTASQALAQLKSSIHLENGALFFQIPALYLQPERWEIHISGRTQADEMGMSVHYFEDTNQAKDWQPGTWYSFQPDGSFTELGMTISFTGETVSDDIDLLPYLRGDAAGLSTIAGLGQSLSQAWLETWYAMDGPKSGRNAETPRALPLAIDLNGDGQKEMGVLCNGNLRVSGDSAVLAFYQLGPDGFQEYAVLEGLPWLDDTGMLEIYRGEGTVILHTARPEPQEDGVLYHDCYYAFSARTLTVSQLLWQETDSGARYFDSTSGEPITGEEHDRLLAQILSGAQLTEIYHLNAKFMTSELFTGEKPGAYLTEQLEELL